MFALAILHGLILLAWPVWPVMALGVWWNSDTISHNFIHRPFFGERWQNRLFSAYLSVLLGIPQSLWRSLHLAHHAGTRWRGRVGGQMVAEAGMVLGLWTVLAFASPRFFLTAYLPGYAAGLALCAMQGHYEHARGVVSHYGAVYNFLCFNDGYHAEHHAFPGVVWRDLPSRRMGLARSSRWPALLRWIDGVTLEGLERLVLRVPALQRFVVSRHRRAIAGLLPPDVERAVIVGGGLFPRSAIILRELLPEARITVIEADAGHIEIARRLVEGVDFELRRYAGETLNCDLAVIPLSFSERDAMYRNPPAPVTLVHDWIWRRGSIWKAPGASRIVSWLMLKRVNRA